MILTFFFFFSSRRRHTRFDCDWSSDVCSSDLMRVEQIKYECRNYRVLWNRRSPRQNPSKSPRLLKNSHLKIRPLKNTVLNIERELPLLLHPRYLKLGLKESLKEPR